MKKLTIITALLFSGVSISALENVHLIDVDFTDVSVNPCKPKLTSPYKKTRLSAECIKQMNRDAQEFVNRIQNDKPGNVDGGGTNIEYPDLADLETSLKKAINYITDSREGMNFLIELRDHFPSNQAASNKLSSMDYLKDVKLRDHNESVLQALVGDSFLTKYNRYKTCKFYGQEAYGVYSGDVKFSAVKSCDSYRIDNEVLFNRFVSRDLFHFESECFDSDKKKKSASVSAFNLNARICLSKNDFLKVPIASLDKNITAVILHELTHMFGIGEDAAKGFEYFILNNYDYTRMVIDNRVKLLSDQRIDMTFFIEDLFPEESTLAYAKPGELNFTLLSYELTKFKYDFTESIDRGQFAALYPYHLEKKLDSAIQKIESTIDKYFKTDANGLLLPRRSHFSNAEIKVIYGASDSYDSWYKDWKSSRAKYIKIYKELRSTSRRFVEILNNFDDESLTTNRIDSVLEINDRAKNFDPSNQDEFSVK